MDSRYMHYNAPVMLDEADVLKVVRKIKQKNIYQAKDLNKSDMFKLVKHLCPAIDEKSLENQQKNYARCKDNTLPKMYPQIIVQLFLDSIWWEDKGHWSTDKHFKTSLEHRWRASGRKRLTRLLKIADDAILDIDRQRYELETSMKQNNMISIEEHEEKIYEKDLVIKALREESDKKIASLVFKLDKEKHNREKESERYNRLNDHVYQGKPLVEVDDEDDAAGVGLVDSDHE